MGVAHGAEGVADLVGVESVGGKEAVVVEVPPFRLGEELRSVRSQGLRTL